MKSNYLARCFESLYRFEPLAGNIIDLVFKNPSHLCNRLWQQTLSKARGGVSTFFMCQKLSLFHSRPVTFGGAEASLPLNL